MGSDHPSLNILRPDSTAGVKTISIHSHFTWLPSDVFIMRQLEEPLKDQTACNNVDKKPTVL